MFPFNFQQMRRLLFPLFLLGLFAATVTGYIEALPPFEAADEAAHFLYVHNLLEDRHLPQIISREEVAAQTEPTRQWAIESHQPPLYYAIGAVLISWTDRSDINDYLRTNSVIFVQGRTENNHNVWLHSPESSGDTGTAITVLRLYSLVLGLGTLLFVYLTARLVLGRGLYTFLVTLLVASIPTFISLSLSVNNDNLLILLYSIGVYLCIRVLKQEALDRRYSIAFALVLSAIALTKLTGLSLFVIVFVVLALGVRRGYWTRQQALNTAGIIVVTAAVLAGWWYVRNLSLYGDPLALDATQSIWSREYEIAATSGDAGAELLRIGRSFYMMFGHLHNPVYGSDGVYVDFLLIVLIGLVGVIRAIRNPQAEGRIPILSRMWRRLTHSVFAFIDALDRFATSLEARSDPSPTPPQSVGEGLSPFPYRDGGRAGDGGQRGLPTLLSAMRSRHPNPPAPALQRDTLWLLLGVCGVVIAMLLAGTRSVDISYGRLLFPALGAFALLIVIGWRSLLGDISLLLIVPLVLIAVTTPYRTIQPAYPRLGLPSDFERGDKAELLQVKANDLEIQAIDDFMLDESGNLTFDIYLRGSHPDNPFLSVTALDSLTMERLGHTEVYPGSAPTDSLPADQVYRAKITMQLDTTKVEIQRPHVILLDIAWQAPANDKPLPLVDGAGNPIDRLIVTGPVLVDPAYVVPEPDQGFDPPVLFTYRDDTLQLWGYTLSTDQLRPGDTLDATFNWNGYTLDNEEWILTLQLLDMEGNLITQNDGPIPGLPTSRFGVLFAYTRSLTMPADILPGQYRLLVGWYRDDVRMDVVNTTDQIDNLLILWDSITVE